MGVMSGERERYLPLAHVFMAGRAEEDYRSAIREVFGVMGSKRRTLSLRQVIMDFEAAMWKAIPAAIGTWQQGVRFRGCLFHFSQALNRAFEKLVPKDGDWRKREVLSLMRWLPYQEYPTIHWFVSQLSRRETGMERFVDYFTSFWMGKSDWWMVSDDVDCDVLTTCALEGYHGKLGLYMPYRHDTVAHTAKDLLRLDFKIIGRAENDQLFHFVSETKEDSEVS